MAAVGNLVQETTTSTGTGNLTVSAVNGKRTFNTEFGTGGTDVFFYFVSNRDAAEWEVGTGSLSTSTTLVRDTVIASSNAGSAVNFSAGTKDVVNDIAVRTTGADFGTTNILTTGAVGRDTDNDIDWSTDDQLTVTVGGAAVIAATSTSITSSVGTFTVNPSSGLATLDLQNNGGGTGIQQHINFRSVDSGSSQSVFSRISQQVVDDTATSEESKLLFYTTVAGTLSQRLQLASGLWGAGATGTDQGAGTSNWTAAYDDGSLLSCYPFDAFLDGEISDAKWDAKVPNKKDEDGNVVEVRTHEPMRKFRARLGTDKDPLTCDGYAKHWKEKRHLTSMPNEENYDIENASGGRLSTGEFIQRLVETVEIQAILIEELNHRLKVLEG